MKPEYNCYVSESKNRSPMIQGNIKDLYMHMRKKIYYFSLDRTGITSYHLLHHTEKMTKLADRSNYSRAEAEENKEQQTPNTDWQGDR